MILTSTVLAQASRPPVPTSYWTEVTLETTFHLYSGSDTASGTLYFDSPNNRMLTKTESVWEDQYEFEYNLKLEDEGSEITYYTSDSSVAECAIDCCRGYFDWGSPASSGISTAPVPTYSSETSESSDSYNSWWSTGSSDSSITSDTYSVYTTWWTTGSTIVSSWYNGWSTWSTQAWSVSADERKEFQRNALFAESFEEDEDPLDWIPGRWENANYMELANPLEENKMARKEERENFSKTFLSRLLRGSPSVELEQVACSAHLINIFADLQRARSGGFCYDGKSMANLWVNYNNDECTVSYCIRTNGVPLYIQYDYVAYTTYVYFESWEEGPQPDSLFVIPPICEC